MGAKAEAEVVRELSSRAADLRRAFDRSFSEAPASDEAEGCDLLAVRIAGDVYAIRLAEVAGLFVDRVVTSLPSPVPELVGIAGFRAALVPVYDLAALLGYSGGGGARWMISTAGEAMVCLLFDRFEGHVRVPRSALVPDRSRAHRHVEQVAHTAESVRPVIHLPSVLEAIKARARGVARPKER